MYALRLLLMFAGLGGMVLTIQNAHALSTSNLPSWTKVAGIDTLLVEKHDTPLVTLSVSFNAGAYYDSKDKLGLASLAGSMMLRGTKKRTREQIESELDFLGTSIGVDVGFQSMTFRGQVLNRNLPRFMQLLTEILTEPVFPEEELKKLREETIAQLYLRLEDDAGLARKFFSETVFQGHPYASDTNGTVTTLKNITREDVTEFYRKYIDRQGLLIGASGDLDQKTFHHLVEEVVRPLPTRLTQRSEIRFESNLQGRHVFLVDKPDRTQTQFLLGQPTIDINHKDFFPLNIFLTAFAGRMFQAQYMHEIRVKRGWAYGASGSLDTRKDGGAFYLYTYPAVKDTLPALTLSLELLDNAVQGTGLKDEQFEFAKNYLKRGFPFMIDLPETVMGQMMNDRFLGRSDDYLQKYISNIEAVTPKAAREAAKRHFNSANLYIVVLCTAKDFKDTIGKAVGAKDVTIVPYDKM